MSFFFNNRGVSHLDKDISAIATELRIPWPDFPQFDRTNARNIDFMTAVLRGPVDREIVKIDLSNNFDGQADKYLKVERGQGGSQARAWPAGTLIYLSTHAEHYNDCFQPDSTRQIDFNPNGALVPDYAGEKVFQYAGCAIRWWMGFDSVNPYWQLIAGEPCENESFADPGWGFRVWFDTTPPFWVSYFDDTRWEPADLVTPDCSWDGEKWVPNTIDVNLRAIGSWPVDYRPILMKFWNSQFAQRSDVAMRDQYNGKLTYSGVDYQNTGPQGNVYHLSYGYGQDILRFRVEGNPDPIGNITDIAFYAGDAPVTAKVTESGQDGRFYVFDNTPPAWSNTRDAVLADVVADTANTIFVTCSAGGGGYTVARAWIIIDLTTVLPTVTAQDIVEAELLIHAIYRNGRRDDICLQESNMNVPVDASGYSSAVGPLLNNNFISVPVWDERVSFWLNDAGKQYVASRLGVGLAKFIIRDYQNDYLNIAPVDTFSVGLRSWDYDDHSIASELRLYGDF